jgi:FkbM family methyltransferase
MVGGYKNVVPCGAALGDKTGVVDILLPEEGRRNIYLAKLDHDKRERGIRFSVLCFRIDDLYSSGCLDRVDFIKCDVEGAELLVFQGARDTIMTFKPAVICEIGGGCKSFGYTSEDLFGWFRKHGYSSFYYDGNKLVPCDGINNMNSNSNYIFLTSQRYAKIIQHKPNLAIKIG